MSSLAVITNVLLVTFASTAMGPPAARGAASECTTQHTIVRE
jgi:hypothetical protein